MYPSQHFYVYCCSSCNSFNGDDDDIDGLYRVFIIITAYMTIDNDEKGVPCLASMWSDDVNVHFACSDFGVLIFCRHYLYS